MRRRADVRLWRVLVSHFKYKPFMWCRSDIRLWHALSFFFCYKPFMWCRPDARLWHYCSAFSARGVFQTLVWHLYYYSAFSARGVIQTLVWHPVSYFGIFLTICVHLGFSYISWQACDHLIIRSMFDIYYTRVLNVCEYIQTYSLACPWLLSWPDFLHEDKNRGDNLGAFLLAIAASRR